MTMIKQLIAAALAALTLLTTPTVQAKDIAWMNNNANTRIIIQSYQCSWQGWERGMTMYTTLAGGRTIYGCWWYELSSDTIHARWANGESYTYVGSRFTFFEK